MTDLNFDQHGLTTRVSADTALPIGLRLESRDIMTVDLANLRPLTKEIIIGKSVFKWSHKGKSPRATITITKIAENEKPTTIWMNNLRIFCAHEGEMLSDNSYIRFPVEETVGLKINGQTVNLNTMRIGEKYKCLQHQGPKVNMSLLPTPIVGQNNTINISI